MTPDPQPSTSDLLPAAVRPPEYFPRLDFFALAQRAGQVVLGDTFQYSRQSYQNRTRIRTPQGWMWLTVPLEGGQHGRPIREVRLDATPRWRTVHLRALTFNYGAAPYFEHYEPHVRALLDEDHPTLGALTVATTRLLHRLLGLSTPLVLASEIPGVPRTLESVLQATRRPRLLTLPDAAARDGAATGVEVIDWEEPVHRQQFEGFVQGLSALDALFLFGPDARSLLG